MNRLIPSCMLLLGLAIALSPAQAEDLATVVDQRIRALEPKVIAWRRDLHEHPELSNRETRTGEMIAAHLRKLGMEVRTGVGHTGVVGLLKGGKPGPSGRSRSPRTWSRRSRSTNSGPSSRRTLTTCSLHVRDRRSNRATQPANT